MSSTDEIGGETQTERERDDVGDASHRTASLILIDASSAFGESRPKLNDRE